MSDLSFLRGGRSCTRENCAKCAVIVRWCCRKPEIRYNATLARDVGHYKKGDRVLLALSDPCHEDEALLLFTKAIGKTPGSDYTLVMDGLRICTQHFSVIDEDTYKVNDVLGQMRTVEDERIYLGHVRVDRVPLALACANCKDIRNNITLAMVVGLGDMDQVDIPPCGCQDHSE
jgi:hypothetical protein